MEKKKRILFKQVLKVILGWVDTMCQLSRNTGWWFDESVRPMNKMPDICSHGFGVHFAAVV